MITSHQSLVALGTRLVPSECEGSPVTSYKKGFTLLEKIHCLIKHEILSNKVRSVRLSLSSVARTKFLTGFTFVELMVTISIFSIVGLAIYSTFGTGVNAWRRGQQGADFYQDARLSLNIMARELRNSIFYKDLEFVGQEDKVSFPCLINTAVAGAPQRLAIGKVTYWFDSQHHALLRSEETLAESFQENQGETMELASSVVELDFSYSFRGEERECDWLDSWGDVHTIPLGIKIALAFEDEKSQEKTVFTKTVFIPTGVMGETQAE